MSCTAAHISLIEHCVTFRHDKPLLTLLGFVHNWQSSRWSATKKENRFSLNGNGIMSSFLGRQFYRSTLYNYYFLFGSCFFSGKGQIVLSGKYCCSSIWVVFKDENKNIAIEILQCTTLTVVSILLYGCTTWTLTKGMEKKP